LKILVIQTAFIGDVILATPVIDSLYRNHPDWQIDVLVRKGNEGLLKNFPGINKVYIWDKKRNKIKNLLKLSEEFRQVKYDEIINLQRFISTGLLTTLSGAKTTTGFDKNPLSIFFTNKIIHQIKSKIKIHEVERNLKLIKHLGGDQILRPSLYPSINDDQFTESFKKTPYFCLAPTSVWFTKQLPPKKWATLIKDIHKKNQLEFNIYLIGGPDDFNACKEIINLSGIENCINLAGKLSFLQTASLMKNSKMNYVNDSAPMHIASAMNAPTTVFYCSTIPDFGFGPLSENKHIFEIESPLDCRPCGLHGYKTCPKGHFSCGAGVPVEKSVVII